MQCTANREQQQTTNDHPGDIMFAKLPSWQLFLNIDSQLLDVKRVVRRGCFKTNTSSSHTSSKIKSRNITDVHVNIFINYHI
jgi:hypothetical protein